MGIVTEYFTRNPCYKKGQTIQVKGLMLHSIGYPQPNPRVFANLWNKESYNNACVHGFIGEDETIISLPCMVQSGKAMRGWHCGDKGNSTHLGFEMCEPSCIKYTGGANFTCSDRAAAVAFVEKVTANAVELFAQLCTFHNLNPNVDIISHAEGHDLGIASNHGDPDHLWAQLDMDYNMDTFRSDVASRMKGGDGEVTQEQFDQMMDNWLKRREQEEPADWSEAERKWAEKNGIIYGDGSGSKMYLSFCTREQMIVFLCRLAEKLGLA